MTRILPVAAVAGALALAAAGCSGSSSGEKSQPSAPGAISMRNLQFAPRVATVKVGEKVTWTNDDSVEHNVTAASGAKFRSQAFGHGKSYSFTPRTPGRVAYVCTLHPGMKATLLVRR